jgi:4-amino-4-deoxy-L-arabinose transferase-like glycosyltransferase
MRNYKLLLFIIILVSVFLRVYKLASIPEGFHNDEAAFGYNAYSLLKTGKDEYGKPFPFIMKSFGEDKPALYSYVAVPFIAIFGLNEFSVRLPSALFGIVFVLFAYLLTFELTKDKSLSLVAAALACLSPTGILQSRVQSNPMSADVMIIISIYELLRWMRTKKWLHFVIAVILIFTSPLMYLSAQLFYPFILPYLYFNFRNSMKTQMKTALILLTVFFVAYSVFLYVVGGTRYGQVSVFSNATITNPLAKIANEEGVAGTPPFVTRIFHNKAFTYFRYLSRETSKYLTFDFLFLEAKEPLRERIHEVGIFYLGEVLFLFLGFISVVRSKKKYVWFLLYWIAISIVGISFAIEESPNIHRFFIVLLPFHIIIASGIMYFWEMLKLQFHKKVAIISFLSVVVLVYGCGMIFFIHQLFVLQPVHDPYFRDFAYKELISKLNVIQGSYDTIIFTKGNANPYIHLLFHNAFDPNVYQTMGSPKDMNYARFNNLVFVPEECPFTESRFDMYKTQAGAKNLFINRGGCPKTINAHVVDTIRWRDTMEAFQLIEYVATPTGALNPNP